MTAWRCRCALVFVVFAALLAGLRGRADEGFRLFNAPPKAGRRGDFGHQSVGPVNRPERRTRP